MKKQKKEMWGVGFNLSGLWKQQPARMYKLRDCDFWHDRPGNLCIYALGLTQGDGYTYFMSESKKEVELFIAGVKAALHILKYWTKDN